jgi:hypothetical protein
MEQQIRTTFPQVKRIFSESESRYIKVKHLT